MPPCPNTSLPIPDDDRYRTVKTHPGLPDPGPLCGRLAASAAPVERELAALLAAPALDAGQLDRLQRYQRKVDVAPRVATAYDETLRKPLSDRAIGDDGHLALAWLFLRAAIGCEGGGAATGPRLRWLNAAFKALDRVPAPPPAGPREPLHEALETAAVGLLPSP